MTDNTELKRLAEAAYPGPWCLENGMNQVRDNADDFVCDTGEDEPINSAFIAAANPAAVLALIAENESLHAQHARDSGELRKLCAARDSARRERDQLRAEVAGLKTGYEAYELVNAELKAENEALRKDAELHAQIQRAAGELPAGWEIRVCVEHESGYVELWDQDGCEVDFPNSCESLGLTVSDAIDAAMGKGEKS
ncbi:hypothetical protein [Pseudomonas extremaustralis]|uniref:hypothetical protein n=1 Tax=Pseudomonas extremaustralis TaxID=359110 RepID=UPI002AA6FD83|nr:hypothetical protein [Pseudomonas extremaustralis]